MVRFNVLGSGVGKLSANREDRCIVSKTQCFNVNVSQTRRTLTLLSELDRLFGFCHLPYSSLSNSIPFPELKRTLLTSFKHANANFDEWVTAARFFVPERRHRHSELFRRPANIVMVQRVVLLPKFTEKCVPLKIDSRNQAGPIEASPPVISVL